MSKFLEEETPAPSGDDPGLSLVRPSVLASFLKSRRHTPVHRLGQHFLVDAHALEAGLDAAALTHQDTVLEIGSGAGALTQALLDRAGKVVAIEIDRRLAGMLAEHFQGHPNLQIIQGDALRLPLADFVDPEKTKVVANLPYYLTTPLWTRLIESKFPLLVLMIQKEVAERATALPGEEAYGAFTLYLAYHGRTELVAKVPPGAFFPRPKVHSCLIRFTLHPTPPVDVPADLFERVVRGAFRHRRKTLLRALVSSLGLAPRAFESGLDLAGLDPKRRGETFSLQEMAKICQIVASIEGG